MKKIICVILMVVMMLTICACGGKEERFDGKDRVVSLNRLEENTGYKFKKSGTTISYNDRDYGTNITGEVDENSNIVSLKAEYGDADREALTNRSLINSAYNKMSNPGSMTYKELMAGGMFSRVIGLCNLFAGNDREEYFIMFEGEAVGIGGWQVSATFSGDQLIINIK